MVVEGWQPLGKIRWREGAAVACDCFDHLQNGTVTCSLHVRHLLAWKRPLTTSKRIVTLEETENGNKSCCISHTFSVVRKFWRKVNIFHTNIRQLQQSVTDQTNQIGVFFGNCQQQSDTFLRLLSSLCYLCLKPWIDAIKFVMGWLCPAGLECLPLCVLTCTSEVSKTRKGALHGQHFYSRPQKTLSCNSEKQAAPDAQDESVWAWSHSCGTRRVSKLFNHPLCLLENGFLTKDTSAVARVTWEDSRAN